MPLVHKKVKQDILIPDGMICDICQLIDKEGTNSFNVDYTFGYGTKLDGTNLQFALCDNCLIDLVTKNVPHACFRLPSGKIIYLYKGPVS